LFKRSKGRRSSKSSRAKKLLPLFPLPLPTGHSQLLPQRSLPIGCYTFFNNLRDVCCKLLQLARRLLQAVADSNNGGQTQLVRSALFAASSASGQSSKTFCKAGPTSYACVGPESVSCFL